MRKYYSLYGRLLSKTALFEAYTQVKQNKGAAGIDRQSLSQFDENVSEELSRLLLELKEKRYQAQPVRRVTIPKDDGGERHLGIPTVRDRIVQQALHNILEPIFEPNFHPSSYGYRKGRSCHQAISKASLFIRNYGRAWVVDMDLSKCFDTLDHELILKSLHQWVTDGSVLNLVKQFLESGVMIGDHLEPTTRGSPQGGVISPLLANIYLDHFDQTMKARGHRIIRYADDILILCTSERGAQHAQRVATEILEGELKLTVNRTKTHIAHSDQGVKFLGVEVHTRYTRVQDKKVAGFKAKVKKLTRRNQGSNLIEIIDQLNPILRGFVNYFRIANCSRLMKQLMGWVRRRLRSIQLALWRKPKRLHRRLRQQGLKGPLKSIKMKSWRNARSPYASFAMPNAWFHKELWLEDMSQWKTGLFVQDAN